METATDTIQRSNAPDNRDKRVRFTDESSAGTTGPQSPYGLAKFRANVTIASLPVTIKSLVEHYVFEYFKLKASLARCEKIKLNLANDSFIPRSARIKFAIGASTRAQEAFPTEYDNLQEKVETAVGVFELTCKAYIKTSLELEMKALHNDSLKLFCQAALALATCCAIDAPAFDKSYGPLLVNATFEAHSTELLKHAGLLTQVQFFTAFHRYTDSPGNVHQVGDIPDADRLIVAPLVAAYKPIILGLFVHPWDAYTTATETQIRSLQIQEFAELSLKARATENTAMDLEEITAESQALKDAVVSENRNANKHLQKQIDRLTQLVNRNPPKNCPPGAAANNKTGSQTKSGKRGRQQPHKPKQDAQKAAAPANATAKGSNKKKNTSNNSKNKRKPKKS
jgi:hypothetical protein